MSSLPDTDVMTWILRSVNECSENGMSSSCQHKPHPQVESSPVPNLPRFIDVMGRSQKYVIKHLGAIYDVLEELNNSIKELHASIEKLTTQKHD